MTLQALIYFARELNPVMEEPGEDFNLDCIDKIPMTETSRTYHNNVNNYRKPFIPYNQGLNTHTIHAGAA